MTDNVTTNTITSGTTTSSTSAVTGTTTPSTTPKKQKASQRFGIKINQTKVMLAGLTANADQLATRGVNSQFITDLTTTYNDLRSLDNDRQALRARQKQATETIHQKLVTLDSQYSLARKLVKIQIDQPAWVEFGITTTK